MVNLSQFTRLPFTCPHQVEEDNPKSYMHTVALQKINKTDSVYENNRQRGISDGSTHEAVQKTMNEFIKKMAVAFLETPPPD